MIATAIGLYTSLPLATAAAIEERSDTDSAPGNPWSPSGLSSVRVTALGSSAATELALCTGIYAL